MQQYSDNKLCMNLQIAFVMCFLCFELEHKHKKTDSGEKTAVMNTSDWNNLDL